MTPEQLDTVTPAQAVQVEPPNNESPDRNRRINKLSSDLWGVVQDDDPEAPIKSNAVWDLLVQFEKDILSALNTRSVAEVKKEAFEEAAEYLEAKAPFTEEQIRNMPIDNIHGVSRSENVRKDAAGIRALGEKYE